MRAGTGPGAGPGTAPVVVVGAGPVGLTAALLLAARQVPCVVVERRRRPPARDPLAPLRADFTDGSRAVVTQRSSLEAWDEADPGISRRLASVGVTWTRKETWWGTRRLAAEEYLPAGATGRTGHPPFLNVPQPTVERALLDAAAAHPPEVLDVLWDTSVSGLDQGEERVTLHTSRGPVTASWVVAADGARSTVRRALGIHLPRVASRNWFVIADVHDTASAFPFGAATRRFTYAPPGDPRGHLLAMPQPDGVWRLDWQSPDRLDLDAERRSGRLDDRVRRAVGDVPFSLEWVSRYRFENGVAERFHAHRVVLAGDAAHRLSPFGGRGMNSGVTDARAAVAALAGGPAAVAAYGTRRRDAALRNVAATTAALRVMEPRTVRDRAAKAVALRLAPWSRRARRHLDTGPYLVDTGTRLAPAATPAGHPAPPPKETTHMRITIDISAPDLAGLRNALEQVDDQVGAGCRGEVVTAHSERSRHGESWRFTVDQPAVPAPRGAGQDGSTRSMQTDVALST